jgi:hypothetical protein
MATMEQPAWWGLETFAEMYPHFKDSLTTRKARLLGCAACRLVWDSLADARSRRAVEVSELYADEEGRPGSDLGHELAAAWSDAKRVVSITPDVGEEAGAAEARAAFWASHANMPNDAPADRQAAGQAGADPADGEQRLAVVRCCGDDGEAGRRRGRGSPAPDRGYPALEAKAMSAAA